MKLKKFLPPEDLHLVIKSTHRPLTILRQLGRDLGHARNKRWLHELNLPFVDAQLVELSNILGSCERIKNTPIPFTYNVLIRRIVATYCFFFHLVLLKRPEQQHRLSYL